METQKKIRITFESGAGTVTGANFLIETLDEAKPFKALVDCGLLQGVKASCDETYCGDENRRPFSYDPKEIDALFITHAHLDHIGRIPKLVAEGFKGTIYSTPETFRITKVMLDDSVGLLEREAQKQNLPPLYSRADVEASFRLWDTIPYRTERTVGPFSVFLKDAGHILGSSMFEFSYNNSKLLCTGDVGNTPTPLLQNTESPVGAKYMLVESVYGDRNHESAEDRDAKFAQVVREAIDRGGALIIPAFSLERTQVVLYMLNNLLEQKKIPSVPVYLDSPLAIKVTRIYKDLALTDFNDEVKRIIRAGDDIFKFPRLTFTESTEDSKAIFGSSNPKIIIAGSGMSNGGRVVHHERHYLPDPKSTLLIIGYEASGTLGRIIQDGAKQVTISGETVAVNAKIESISGYSAHKDSNNLVEFVSEAKDTLKKVFVVMGEPKSSLFLAQRIRDEVGVEAVAPMRAESVILEM